MAMVVRDCPRCGGSGFVPRFGHYAKGVCFRCSGNGKVKMRAHRDGSIDHDHRIGWPVEDHCVVPGCGLPIAEWPPVVAAFWYEAIHSYEVFVPRPGLAHERRLIEGETRRKAQGIVRRAVLAELPNARIKWAA